MRHRLTRSGPPWSVVEHASTHPHAVRLRLVLGDGNEVVSRCSRPEHPVAGPRQDCSIADNLAVSSRNVQALKVSVHSSLGRPPLGVSPGVIETPLVIIS